jgi:hypothetical protein
MELPDPKEFATNRGRLRLEQQMVNTPQLKVWLDRVLAERLILPSNRRCTLQSVLKLLRANLSGHITSSSLQRYWDKYFYKRVKVDDRRQTTTTGQGTDPKPPGWIREQTAAGVPDETEAND